MICVCESKQDCKLLGVLLIVENIFGTASCAIFVTVGLKHLCRHQCSSAWQAEAIFSNKRLCFDGNACLNEYDSGN